MALISHPFAGVSQLISLKFVLAAIGYGLIPHSRVLFFYMHGLSHGLETSKVPVVASVENRCGSRHRYLRLQRIHEFLETVWHRISVGLHRHYEHGEDEEKILNFA